MEAERALSVVTPLAGRAPRAVGWGLAAATALMATSPGAVGALGDGGSPADGVPLLRDRAVVADIATAYVCSGFVCDAPTTSPTALADRVGARARSLEE